jgi:hypothetical protein
MSGRTDAIFLRHILDASLKVASYIGAMTEADFVRETMTHDAVMSSWRSSVRLRRTYPPSSEAHIQPFRGRTSRACATV